MTCCVAALCDDRKGIVLVSDKMIGMVGMESEPDISKIFRLHNDWWVMLAGDGISPAFDIIDRAKQSLSRRKSISVSKAIAVVSSSFYEKREQEAETTYLTPMGWTIKKFNSSASKTLPESVRLNLIYQLASYSLPISLLVVGFDDSGRGHIFSIEDGPQTMSKGLPQRHDLPGYYSIGSGSFGALYMMGYREVGPKMAVREALYYAVEGKYFGEFASGVGLRTDLLILRYKRPFIRLSEKAVDKKLMKLCERLGPRDLINSGVDVLNSLHGKRMNTIPQLRVAGKSKDRKITILKPSPISP